MHVRQKTNPGMLPQSQALEPQPADNPCGGHETGLRGRMAPGVQHGREGRSRKAAVTPARGAAGVQRVFVLDRRGNPLMPCHPARARELLAKGRAAVVRYSPFVIRLKDRDGGETQPVHLGVDPGSKTTGMAVSRDDSGIRHVMFRLEVAHRSEAVSKKMRRRAAYRRRRRAVNLRYRAPRFSNRRRPEGWLPPSLQSRVQHIESWARRLQRWCPLTAVDLELVRFDTQALQNPEISGTEYQQGTLAGYEVREYLLAKFGRRCVYCGATGVPLNIDHVVPRSCGGSDRITNLVLACVPCNQAKGNRDVREFAPDKAAQVLAHAKAPLRDAAAVNSTRFAALAALRQIDLPVECSTGGRTKFNRHAYGIPKAHCLDAACAGEMAGIRSWCGPVLVARAIGRGSHQRTRTDAHGFPRNRLPRSKRLYGFGSGDLVRADVPSGKQAGRHVGRTVVRSNGSFTVGPRDGIGYRHCTLLQRADGYDHLTEGRSGTRPAQTGRGPRAAILVNTLTEPPAGIPGTAPDPGPGPHAPGAVYVPRVIWDGCVRAGAARLMPAAPRTVWGGCWETRPAWWPWPPVADGPVTLHCNGVVPRHGGALPTVCAAVYRPGIPGAPAGSLDEARRMAASFGGWRRTRTGDDLCPPCAALTGETRLRPLRSTGPQFRIPRFTGKHAVPA